MNSKDYFNLIGQFDLYPSVIKEIFENNNQEEVQRFMVTLMHFVGLSGEVGELGEKIKKSIRDKRKLDMRNNEIAKELGDVEWYLTRLEHDFRYAKNEIMEMNYEKLAKRLEENKLHGEGDNR